MNDQQQGQDNEARSRAVGSNAGLGVCQNGKCLWEDDGDNLQIVCEICGERRDVDFAWRPGELEELVKLVTPNVQIEGQPASGLSRSNAGLGPAERK